MFVIAVAGKTKTPESDFERSRCSFVGFGKQVTWQDAEVAPANHTMPFKRALHLMCTDIIFKIAVPEAMLRMTERTRAVRDAFYDLKVRYLMLNFFDLLNCRFRRICLR
jgi:hypothetical protein